MVFDSIARYGHEQVVFCHLEDVGLRAVVAIHSTVLGPALGGLRMWPYRSEQEAVEDALRLARGMTYKNAVAGLDHGGGKAVILGDPRKDKSESLFRAFGRFVQSLGGRYITAEDVGIDVDDMQHVFQETDYVTGLHATNGGAGDPSPFTARGALIGLKAALQRAFGHDDVGRVSHAVQGVGHVGREYARLLREQDAKVFVTDIDAAAVRHCVEEYGCEAVDVDEIYDVGADVFSPAALGGTVNERTLPRLQCRVICGPANNQLASEAIGDEVHRRGIVYAPDYAVNAGGVMNVSLELEGYDRERALHRLRAIHQILRRVFEISDAEGIPTYRAADRLAEERIAKIGRTKLPTMEYPPRRRARMRVR